MARLLIDWMRTAEEVGMSDGIGTPRGSEKRMNEKGCVMGSEKQGEMNIVDENKMRDEKQGEMKKQGKKAKTRQEKTHCENTEGGARSARSNEKKAHRKLSEVSDEELCAAAEKANSFPELKRLLGINPDEKNERIRTKARKAGCKELLNGCYDTGGVVPRINGMNKTDLQAIADECDTYSEFGKQLGYANTSCCTMAKKIIQKYELEFCPKHERPEYSTLNPKRHNVEYVQKIANESYTFVEVTNKLGYKNANNVHRLLDKLGIDYSHFDKDRHKRGTRHCLDDLTENTAFNSKVLRELLESIGKVKCEICSCENQWNGKELVLEVHHKNGNHHDNRVENLMLVCPTCHAYIEDKIGGLNKRSPNSFEYEILKKRGHRCEECKNIEWKDGLIPLEVHHIDGNHQNNTSENVKLLCPNCHSQTKTFGCQQYIEPISDEEYVEVLWHSKTIKQAIEALGRAVSGPTYKRIRKLIEKYKILHLMPLDDVSIVDVSTAILAGEDLCQIQDKWGLSTKELYRIINGTHPLSPSDFVYPLLSKITTEPERNKRKTLKVSDTSQPIKYCCDCNKPIFHNGERCQECEIQHRRESFPSKHVLKNLIRTMSFLAIGKQYGVSGNAVVRWCKYHGLPWRKIDINSFTDEEWDMLETFSEDMKNPRILHDYDAVIDILEKYHSAKYASQIFGVSIDTINDIRKQRHYKSHMIEWSPTSCHIVGSDLYFRTTIDAGHWLAEQGTELVHIVPEARGRKVKQYIEQGKHCQTINLSTY